MPQNTGQMHVQADPPQPRASRSRKDPRLEHFVKNTAVKNRQRGRPCHQQGHKALRARLPRGMGTGPGLLCWDPHVKLGRRQRQLAGLIQEQRT